MRTILALHFTIALSLMLAPAAFGAHCTTYSTATPEIDTKLASEATGQPRYYGDDDCIAVVVCPDPAFFSFWVYEESNGLEGLQRDDEWRNNTCHGLVAADTLIF